MAKILRTTHRTTLLAAVIGLLTVFGASAGHAGFRTPESVVRNVYGFYGNGASELSHGLLHDTDTTQQFFDRSLRRAWMSATKPPYDFFVQSQTWKLGGISISILRKQYDKTYVAAAFDNNGRPVTLNFVVVNGPDGWLITDVETPHDSLRAFLAQYGN